MDTYIGMKIVEAEPMNATAAGRALGRPIDTENAPDGQGYLVRYPDGYRSWSPKKQFEEAYRETTSRYGVGPVLMPFGMAIEAAKKGNKIARIGWNGNGMFVVYMPPLALPPHSTQEPGAKVNDRTAKFIGEDTPLDCQPYFAMFTAQKQWQPGWLASQTDMLAEDWFVVES